MELALDDWDLDGLRDALSEYAQLRTECNRLERQNGWDRPEEPVRVREPLPEVEAHRFETSTGVDLPHDYRRVLTEVADGLDHDLDLLVPLAQANDTPDRLAWPFPADLIARTSHEVTRADPVWSVSAGLGPERLAGTVRIAGDTFPSTRLVVVGEPLGTIWIDYDMNWGPEISVWGQHYTPRPQPNFREYLQTELVRRIAWLEDRIPSQRSVIAIRAEQRDRFERGDYQLRYSDTWKTAIEVHAPALARRSGSAEIEPEHLALAILVPKVAVLGNGAEITTYDMPGALLSRHGLTYDEATAALPDEPEAIDPAVTAAIALSKRAGQVLDAAVAIATERCGGAVGTYGLFVDSACLLLALLRETPGLQIWTRVDMTIEELRDEALSWCGVRPSTQQRTPPPWLVDGHNIQRQAPS